LLEDGIILGGKFEVNPGLEAKTLSRICKWIAWGEALEEYQRCMAAKRKRPMV
jgi:hypothetical protein